MASLDPACIILESVADRYRDQSLNHYPELLTKVLKEIRLPLAIKDSYCLSVFQNRFGPATYATKECCEAEFDMNSQGMLTGGQFNGLPWGFNNVSVSGVRCHTKTAGAWTAICETIPGGYVENWAGSCEEDDKPVPNKNPEIPFLGMWNVVNPAVRQACWAVRLAALSLFALACSCYGCAMRLYLVKKWQRIDAKKGCDMKSQSVPRILGRLNVVHSSKDSVKRDVEPVVIGAVHVATDEDV